MIEIKICDEWYCLDDGALHNWSNSKEYFVDAFTVAELGCILSDIATYKTHHGEWTVRIGTSEGKHFINALTEVKARAGMLIFLIENGFDNVSDIKSRVCPEGSL